MQLKINSKGQVTIPSDLRNQLGFLPDVMVKIYASGNGELRVVKADQEEKQLEALFDKMQGYCEIEVSGHEVLALTRGYDLK